jgi:hypothetical protein
MALDGNLDRCFPFSINSPHCIKFLYYEEFLLDTVLGEPLALMKKLPYFDNLIELYALLVGTFQLGVHDLVCYKFLNAIKVEIDSGQVNYHLRDFPTKEKSIIKATSH